MLPIHFEGCNTRFGKPSDMTDEECSSIDACVLKYEDGTVITRTYWMPSKEDVDAIVAGRGIVLDLSCAGGMVPVSIWTFNEKGESNSLP